MQSEIKEREHLCVDGDRTAMCCVLWVGKYYILDNVNFAAVVVFLLILYTALYMVISYRRIIIIMFFEENGVDREKILCHTRMAGRRLCRMQRRK